jgi:dihydroxy-acid dehydratase
VRDGDTVTIDLDARRCDLEIPEAELQARRAAWQPAAPLFDRGWLQIYRRNVGPLNRGAVLVRDDAPRTD